ncbi:MAG: hypothetical protein Q8R72_09255 [Hylemonella sp.]|nr:hypothetical protein [Hylemonella sp.]
MFEGLTAVDGIRVAVIESNRIGFHIADLGHDRMHLIGGVAYAVKEIDLRNLMTQGRQERGQYAASQAHIQNARCVPEGDGNVGKAID